MQESCTKKITTFEVQCSLPCPPLCILFYSILFYYNVPPYVFYFILFYSILFYSHSVESLTQLVQYKLDPQKIAGLYLEFE